MGGVGISIPRSGYFLRGVPRLYNPDERSPKSDFAENQDMPGFYPLSWWHWKHLRKIHNVSNLEILEKLEKGRLYFPLWGLLLSPPRPVPRFFCVEHRGHFRRRNPVPTVCTSSPWSSLVGPTARPKSASSRVKSAVPHFDCIYLPGPLPDEGAKNRIEDHRLWSFFPVDTVKLFSRNMTPLLESGRAAHLVGCCSWEDRRR